MYGPQVDDALRVIDESFDYICAERLTPILVWMTQYECLRCQRTFRVYPKGVTKDHMSQRVKGLGILLYLLGPSYPEHSAALMRLVR